MNGQMTCQKTCQFDHVRLDRIDQRRGGRVVECAGLENRYGCKPIEGSNPSLSANPHYLSLMKAAVSKQR